MLLLKGVLSVALFLGIIAPIDMAIAPPATAKNAKVCAFQSVEPGHWTVYENKLTIKCFGNKFGVSVSELLRIADRESGYSEKAYNESSAALGLYQHLHKYWWGRVYDAREALHRFGIKKRHWYNPRVNIVVTCVYIRHNGWSAWAL